MIHQITIKLTESEVQQLRTVLESQCRISQNLLEIKSAGGYCGDRIRGEEARLLMLMSVLSRLPAEQQAFLFGEL